MVDKTTPPAGPVPEEAMAYLNAKKLTPAFDYRDVWKQEHDAAFTVAKAMQLDVLTDIKEAVDSALKDGKTFAQFTKELQPTLEQKGWWGVKDMQDPHTGKVGKVQLGSPRRLEIIYRTNMETARQAGQWERIQRNKTTHPYLMYELGPSLEHRAEHAAWAGTLLPVDDPWWDAHRPKNGWGCKCRVRQVNKREYDKLAASDNSKTTAPKIEYREWINKRTGEVERVPKGIDPGWDYNPGKTRTAQLLQQSSNKLAAASHDIATPIMQQMVQSEAFIHWYNKPQGNWPIAKLILSDMQRIGAKANIVNLSDETLLKQKREHPEIQADEYQHIQSAIEKGWTVQDSANTLLYVLEELGYVTVIKATKTGKATFVTSFRRLSSDAAKRDEEIKRLLLKRNK